jgi:hypothetical protein
MRWLGYLGYLMRFAGAAQERHARAGTALWITADSPTVPDG